jgi:hypothetical protein
MRGVYMSSDLKTSKIYVDGILKFNKQIAKVVEDWKKSVRGDDAELFGQFSGRIAQFIDSIMSISPSLLFQRRARMR